MPDDKERYLKLFRASEEAVNVLIAAQCACEERYLSSPEPELKILELPPKDAAESGVTSQCEGATITP